MDNNLLHQHLADKGFVALASEIPHNRCTGASTALALRCMSTAMRNPGKRVFLRDSTVTSSRTRALRDNIRLLTEQYVGKLGFVGFDFGFDQREQEHFLTYDLRIK